MAETNIVQANEFNFKSKKLQQITNQIFKQGMTIRKAYAKIAVQLCIIEESKCYELDGFESVHDYSKQILGIGKSQSYDLLRVGRDFVDRKSLESVLPHEENKDYSTSQLQALLPLKSVDTAKQLAEQNIINPTMTVKEIKQVVNDVIHPVEESEENEESASTDEQITTFDESKFDMRSCIELAIDNENGKPVFIYGDIVLDVEQAIDVIRDWVK
jgi:hypothetical protein